ncbi:MAG: hypothetical protein E6J90_01615, partial [Deltaproteobacteria bacterium]
MTMFDHKPGGRSLVEHPVGTPPQGGPGVGKRTLVEDPARNVEAPPPKPGAGPGAVHDVQVEPVGDHRDGLEVATMTTTTTTPGDFAPPRRVELDLARASRGAHDRDVGLDGDSERELHDRRVQALIVTLTWCIELADWDSRLRPALYHSHARPILQHAAADMTGVGSLLVIDPFVGAVKQVQQSWAE